ncbi:MAG TPA: hypothetical protein DCR04_04390 [Flavobacteriales bacterium]|nr:hypothetical protein [Flavobacteriales bacterium]
MKYLLALVIPFLFSAQNVTAQAWTKYTKLISVGLCAGNYYYLGTTRAAFFGPTTGRYNPVTGQISVEGEFGVHEYIGVGFNAGFGGARSGTFGVKGSLNVPVGVLANFHFYQLIEDLTGTNLHAEAIDVFVGVSIGTGLGVISYNNVSDQVVPLVFGGAHVGARWYFSPNIGLSGQFGFGKSLVDLGVVFKLN